MIELYNDKLNLSHWQDHAAIFNLLRCCLLFVRVGVCHKRMEECLSLNILNDAQCIRAILVEAAGSEWVPTYINIYLHWNILPPNTLAWKTLKKIIAIIIWISDWNFPSGFFANSCLIAWAAMELPPDDDCGPMIPIMQELATPARRMIGHQDESLQVIYVQSIFSM